MSEKIYDLLNNVQMDLDEYREVELSLREKQKIKKRLLREVKSMNKNRRRGWKIAGTAVAACMAVSVITLGSNLAEAKTRLSDIYEKIISGSVDDKDAERIGELYTRIGEKSVPVETEGEGIQVEAEAEDVKIQVSDIYCDGYMLYYTLQLKTDNMELAKKGVDGIAAGGEKTTQPVCTVRINNEEEESFIVFEKQKDGTFTSVQSYSFFANENSKTYQDGDIIPIEIDITALKGWDYDHHDESGEYMRTKEVNGEWKLSFKATVETKDNKVQKINKEDNGVKVLSVAKGRGTLNLVIEQPNYSKQPYNDPDISIKGEDGKDLQWLGNYNDIKEDGTCICYITLLDNGDKNLQLEVTEKTDEGKGKQIASIKFPIK